MLNPRSVCLIAVFGICSFSHADLVVYENDGSLGPLMQYDPNFGDLINGQSLDITRGASDQPAIGELPAASIFFMHISDFSGDFIWMGTGRLTLTARSTDGVSIIDTKTQQPVDYFGPQSFANGDVIDPSANFVEGWRTIHGFNQFTAEPGVFAVDETFTVGISFDIDNETRYGFAQFIRSFEVRSGQVLVDITPTVWGYETTPGVGANVVPAPAGVGVLAIGGMLGSFRRRRR